MGVSRRTRQRELKKNLLAFLIVIIFACVIFSINSIGNFIALNVIAPVVNLSAKKSETPLSDTVKTQKLVMYLVSAGEMPDLAEAETLKTLVSEKGGGGYVFQQDNEYSVIHSVFSDNSLAEEMGKKLTSDFTPSVIKITIDETTIRITGKSEQLKTVHSCFTHLNQCATILEQLARDINDNKTTPLEALKEIQKLKNATLNLQNKLKEINSSNVKVLALSDMLVLAETLLNELPTSNDNAFNQKLNYTACAYACRLYDFYSSLE